VRTFFARPVSTGEASIDWARLYHDPDARSEGWQIAPVLKAGESVPVCLIPVYRRNIDVMLLIRQSTVGTTRNKMISTVQKRLLRRAQLLQR
jgi:hypothetical protein